MQHIAGRHELQYVGLRNRTGVPDRTLRRAAERGELIKVHRGVYVASGVWERLSPTDRYRLRVAAAAEVAREPLVLSHRSAAAIWGMPLVGAPPDDVEVLTSRTNGSRREHGFRRRASPMPTRHLTREAGMVVTSIERTVVDLAASMPFPQGVAVVDWALARGIERRDLGALAGDLALGRRETAAQRAIAFGDGRSGSAGESLSRVLIHRLGFPAPELQVRFEDRHGLIGVVDFYWADAGLIGEFDGRVKYEDEAMLAGRRPVDVLMSEKRREDRLRRTGRGVARWVWDDLTPQRLGPILLDAGLVPLNRFRGVA